MRVPACPDYVLVQLLGPVAMLTLLLTSVIWLITSLPLLDLVINRGQSAPTFLYLMLLELPSPAGHHHADRLLLRHPVHPAAAGGRQRAGGDGFGRLFSLRQLAMPVLRRRRHRDDR